MSNEVATEDDEISTGKPFLGRNGEYKNSIKIRKHDIIIIPIQAINKKKDIWGEDAYSFRHVASCTIVCSLTAHRDNLDAGGIHLKRLNQSKDFSPTCLCSSTGATYGSVSGCPLAK
jgi:hypothetical protein